MTAAFIARGDIKLSYVESGQGRPVLFQHGLGADAAQAAEVFPAEPVVLRITLECRGQGRSDSGPLGDLSIRTFSEDLGYLADNLKLGPAVVGGISMGAAIALRLAVRRPDLVRGLILARPAWLFDPDPENMRPNAIVGDLLGRLEPQAARVAFAASETAQHLARDAPDNLASLLGFFDRPAPKTTSALLTAIAGDGPGVTEAEARRIAVPTLVIGHGEDYVHPLAYAERLAAIIPGARLVKITSKVVDKSRYVAEFRAALSAFLSSL